MRRRGIIAGLIFVTVGLLWPVPILAQFPSQQDGHALDANLQYGAFGRNDPISTYPPINYGNLIVTGNVTQGRAFRGFSPIRDVSTFSAGLPSAGISNFARDTVSAGQFLQGSSATRIIAPQAFFATESTVPTAGAVAQGLYPATGPNPLTQGSYGNQHFNYTTPNQTPYSTQYQPLEDTRIQDPGHSLRPDIVPQPGTASPGTRPVANPMLLQSQLLATNRGLSGRAETALGPSGFDEQIRMDRSPRLGVPSELDHTGLDAAARDEIARIGGEVYVPVLSDVDASGATVEDIRRAQEPPDMRVRMQLGEDGVYRMETPSFATGANTTRGLPSAQDRTAVPQAGADAFGRRGAGVTTAGPGLTPPPMPGQDIGELMRAIAPEPMLGEAPSIDMRQPVVGEFETPTVHPPDLVAGDVQSQSDLIDPGSADPSRMLNQPVTSFAGSKDTRINEYVRAAEQYLQDEQYYRAAALFEMSTMIDPKNPLVWLGQGNALIAAGDYRSAIRSLLRGIEQFEDIGFFRMSLHDFIPDASLLESRRASLETQLSARDNPETRFLLGYIEYYTGLETFGMENLRKAAAAAPEDSVIARFPGMLAEATGSDVER